MIHTATSLLDVFRGWDGYQTSLVRAIEPRFREKLAAGRSTSKDNALTFDVEWTTHWANELEFGAEVEVD